jgi:Raf kinase inhibitor-like YbhB/YbcL family protein
VRRGSEGELPIQSEASSETLKLTSLAFEHEGAIPSEYTCDGEDTSPPLEWTAAPEETVEFALIVDDPDAPLGTWVHWVLYGIPADTRSLPPGLPPDAELGSGTLHGKNSWQKLGYGGPCPPGGTHHYEFKLYALDAPLELEPGATKAQLLEAMDEHVLARALLVGTYARD